MTSKSEIASIMLEAAELLREDNELMESGIGRNGKESKKHGHEAAKLIAQGKDMRSLRTRANHNSLSEVETTLGKASAYFNRHPELSTAKAQFIKGKNALQKDIDDTKSRLALERQMGKDIENSPGGNKLIDDNNRKFIKEEHIKALKEAVDVLYEKASLCESAEDSIYYIDQAIALSKEI